MGSGTGMKNMFRLSVLIVTVLACGQLPQKPAMVTDTPPVSLTGKGIIEVEPPGEPSFGWLVWSPDSQFLAIAYNRWWMGKFSLPNLFQIQILDVGSQTMTLLQESVQNYFYPNAWLPDDRIAYYSDKDPEGIWLTSVETKDESFLMQVAGGPIWTRDGNWIAYEPVYENSPVSEKVIAVREVDSQQDKLTHTLNYDENVDLILLDWSPDNKQILFLLRQRLALISEMHVIEVNSGSQYLVGSNGYYGSASWSPDGKYITYAYQEGIGSGFQSDLFIIKYNGTCPTRILDGGDFDIESSVWSPDGKWIAFVWNGGVYLLDTSKVAEIEMLENGSTCP